MVYQCHATQQTKGSFGGWRATVISMELCNNIKNSTSYSDFFTLIDIEHWEISMAINEKWDWDRHLSYFKSIVSHDNAHFLFVPNDIIPKLTDKIDVYMNSKHQENSLSTNTKHIIQFKKR